VHNYACVWNTFLASSLQWCAFNFRVAITFLLINLCKCNHSIYSNTLLFKLVGFVLINYVPNWYISLQNNASIFTWVKICGSWSHFLSCMTDMRQNRGWHLSGLTTLHSHPSRPPTSPSFTRWIWAAYDLTYYVFGWTAFLQGDSLYSIKNNPTGQLQTLL
jgi:hypothetical protein